MGKALAKLLCEQGDYPSVQGQQTKLTDTVTNWKNTKAYSALVIPGSLMMLKDADNKRIAWQALKQKISWSA